MLNKLWGVYGAEYVPKALLASSELSWHEFMTQDLDTACTSPLVEFAIEDWVTGMVSRRADPRCAELVIFLEAAFEQNNGSW